MSDTALVLNEEERLLRDTAREFLESHAPVAALRRLRDTRDELGYSPELWRRMADLGWASITLPEQYGGLDFGFRGIGVVLEECGRTLAASPLFATAVVGASAILLGGSERQRATLLPEVARGGLTLALALEESHHHRPHQIATTAEARGDRFILNGRKTFVLDGHSADRLIVVARSDGDSRAGLTLFLVNPTTEGVVRERTIMADSRNAANIRFDHVTVDADSVLGTVNAGHEILEPVLDRGRVAIAAEMMGLALEAFQRTVAYLKERRQFDAPIGSFQALQHRAALMQTELELARSVVLAALSAVDQTPRQLPLLASLAKARLNELVKLVTNEAVQMHGGIGVTDELEIGFFLKRARVAMQIFGDTGFHRDRYATLCGY
jgi:alkylation response protein AidB-like acyl-CoA dehydrogenase